MLCSPAPNISWTQKSSHFLAGPHTHIQQPKSNSLRPNIPTTWTAERDQRLLLLLVEQVKVNGDAVAAAWKTKYVDTNKDSYVPTARAITEHIGALKKEFGGSTTSTSVTGTPKAKTTATPKATPKATPRKSAAVKTPKSSAKRKRVSHSSDEDVDMKNDADDDSAAERERLNATPSGPRSTLSRRSKSVAKTYNEDDESDDELAAPQDNTRAATPTPTAGEEEEQTDFFGGGAFDGAGEEVGQMDGVAIGVAGVGLVNGTLTPQGKAADSHAKANSAAKRVVKRAVKREEPVDDSDVSEFNPDFM
ncbi:hypothetical protein MBLNU13_g05533t2 [Cladosporium sp. NU13]